MLIGIAFGFLVSTMVHESVVYKKCKEHKIVDKKICSDFGLVKEFFSIEKENE